MFGGLLMVGVDLFSEKNIVAWLLVVGLFGEKSTAGSRWHYLIEKK
jgi:hypothetical protein